MGLLKLLNIEKGEGASAGLMMGQSFFLGAFIMTFQISTNSLFLKEIGGEGLAMAYMISGGLGILLTSFFSVLQKRISFSILANITYLVVALSTLILWIGFDAGFMSKKDLIYWAFLIVGPFIALVAYIVFWGVMGRVFSLRQGKRLFGLIDSGQILAMIVVSFAIPLITALMPDTKDLIMISALCLFVAFFLQIIVSIKFKRELSNSSDDGEEQKSDEAKLSNYIKNPYIMMMATFVFLSMLVQFFVEFSFMKTVSNQYPEERDLTNFFGYFMGTMLIFSFMFKTFVYGKLIQMYGLKVNLLILPLVLIFFTIIASIAGTVFNFEGLPGTFTFFFMFIISSKLFAQSLRVSIEVPAFKIMYQPLDKSIRFDVQARVDGFVNELSAFLGGVILTVLNLVGFKLIHFSWLLIPIIAVWAYLTIKLYDKYQEALRTSLSNMKSSAGQILEGLKTKGITALIEKETEEKNTDRVINALKLSNNVSPLLFVESLEKSLESTDVLLRNFGSNQLYLNKEFGVINKVRNHIGVESQLEAKENLSKLFQESENYSLELLSELQLNKMARSKDAQERRKLIKILTLPSYDPYSKLLVELLKDLDFNVCRDAIMAVALLKKEDLYLPMIENLSKNEYRNITKYSILNLGDSIIEALNTSFYKLGFKTPVLVQVVDLIGQINAEKSQEYLVAKLTVHDIQLIDAVLVALHKCNYQSSENEKGKIIQAIDYTIGVAMWNYATLLEINKYKFSSELLDAISDELKSNLEQIFMLLGLLYDSKSIKQIQQNIESGTAEGIGFSIELLDIFVDEQLKLKLFPLLDDITVEERVKTLQLYYPRFELSKEDALKAILNRSYTELNRWTKACAMMNFEFLESKKIEDDLLAHLFNPDKLLQETAALVISNIDSSIFKRTVKRLDEELQIELDEKLTKINQKETLSFYQKVLFLKSTEALKTLSGKELSLIVDKLQQNTHLKDDVLTSKENESEFIRFLWKGRIILRDEKHILMNYSEKDILSSYQMLHSDDKSIHFVAIENALTFELKNYSIYELVSENENIADAFIQIFNLRFQLKEESNL